MFIHVFIFLIYLLVTPTDAHAYLDPASGSAVLYIIISIFSAGIYFFRNIALNVFNFLAVKLNFQSTVRRNQRIVFYSEGKQYWYVFEPILKWLSSQQEPFLYLTSDKADPGLSCQYPQMEARYIGKVNYAGAYLSQLKTDFLGMTTPQLDVLTIKRSKNIKHYSHIVHAPVDVFTYRKFAFDYFDSVFCSGPHQIKSIRFLEDKRGTPRKQLEEVGCTYYDFMLDKLKNKPAPAKTRPVVLVAPTWKDYSLLHKYGSRFFQQLLRSEAFDVILRPHPQIYTSYPEVIQQIETDFKDHPRFKLDRAPSGEESMRISDVLISDLSGIIWDYVFLFNRPVMLVETPLNLDGFEATEISHPMWELESIPKIGTMIKDGDIDRIDQMVESWVMNPEAVDVRDFRESSLYNWGQAGEVAGKKILEILATKGES